MLQRWGLNLFNVWESSVKHRFLCFDFYSVMDYKGAAFKGNIYGALHLLHLTELSLEEKSAKPAFPLNSTASHNFLLEHHQIGFLFYDQERHEGPG